MPSIDTNLLLRLVLMDVPAQYKTAIGLLEKHEKVAISDLAITETVFVLEKVKGIKRELIVEMIESFVANQGVVMNRTLFSRAIALYVKHKTESFNDCCLAVYAKLNNQTPLYTFDKKMVRDLPHVELVQ